MNSSDPFRPQTLGGYKVLRRELLIDLLQEGGLSVRSLSLSQRGQCRGWGPGCKLGSASRHEARGCCTPSAQVQGGSFHGGSFSHRTPPPLAPRPPNHTGLSSGWGCCQRQGPSWLWGLGGALCPEGLSTAPYAGGVSSALPVRL